MAYFKNFPSIYYNFTVKGEDTFFILKDITVNFRVLKRALENVTIYDEYDVVDGETPEIVSQKIYGRSDYHWVIMLFNNRVDYLSEWVMTYDRLEQYCKDKYGEEEIYSIHHYEDAEGYTVDETYPSATPISNIDYEVLQNENKRRIKLISKRVLQQLIDEFTTLTT